MKTTLDYLDEMKRRAGIDSDYAAAKLLRVTTSAMSRYRTLGMTFDPTTAAKVARILDVNPMEVIAASMHQRVKDCEEKTFWREEWVRSGGESREQIESMAGILVGDSAYQDADCPVSGPLFEAAQQSWHP
jgi:hypothetical protein